MQFHDSSISASGRNLSLSQGAFVSVFALDAVYVLLLAGGLTTEHFCDVVASTASMNAVYGTVQ